MFAVVLKGQHPQDFKLNSVSYGNDVSFSLQRATNPCNQGKSLLHYCPERRLRRCRVHPCCNARRTNLGSVSAVPFAATIASLVDF